MHISNHVTPWLTFRTEKEQTEFEHFKVSQTNLYAFVCMQSFVTLFIAINKWYSWYYFPSLLSLVALIIGLITPCALGFVLVAFRLIKNNRNIERQNTMSEKTLIKIINFCESFWVLMTCVSYSMSIAVVVSSGECQNGDDFVRAQGCNYNDDQMPLDMTMISIILPIMLSAIAKGAKWEFIVMSFVVNFCCLLFLMFYFNLAASSLASLLSFLPFCLVVMYETQRQNVALFLMTQSQQNLLEENERLADEVHANELRHMIGNVAHDLKTVRPFLLNCCGMIIIASF